MGWISAGILYVLGMVLMDYLIEFSDQYLKRSTTRGELIARCVTWPVSGLVFTLPRSVTDRILALLKRADQWVKSQRPR